MKRRMIAATILAATLVFPAMAQDKMKMEGHDTSAAGAKPAPAGALADGEVRKVDKDAGKLTIKHGPIPSMDMPPMTMVYRVKDASMLDKLRAGDKVKFQAEKIGGAYTVTRVEAAK